MKNRALPLVFLLCFSMQERPMHAGFDFIKIVQATGTLGGTLWLLSKILHLAGFLQDKPVPIAVENLAPQFDSLGREIGKSVMQGLDEKTAELIRLLTSQEQRSFEIEGKLLGLTDHTDLLLQLQGKLKTLENIVPNLTGNQARMQNLEVKVERWNEFSEFLKDPGTNLEHLEWMISSDSQAAEEKITVSFVVKAIMVAFEKHMERKTEALLEQLRREEAAAVEDEKLGSGETTVEDVS